MNKVLRCLRTTLFQRGLTGPDASWTRLDGGRTNWVWRVEGLDQTLICKLYCMASNNPLYPNLSGIEFEILNALAAQDMAPRPVARFHTNMGDVLVYQNLEGEIWTSGAGNVARLLARLHKMDPPIALRTVASGSSSLIRQTVRILESCRETVVGLPDFLPDRGIASARRLRLIHTDVVASNLIVTGNGLRLIDWQCPAQGDPCEDIASFLSPAMQRLYGERPLDKVQKMQFLAAYPDQEVVARYHRLAPFFHWRIAAYCQWKVEAGDSDYRPARDLEIAALHQTYADYDEAGQNDANRNVA